MGCDEYHPISKQGSNLTESGGIGYTIIDTIEPSSKLDHHQIVFRLRRSPLRSVADSFLHSFVHPIFQTTIRLLGGFLSAYSLSSDPIYLTKATELADRILPVFDTPSGLPLSMINLAKSEGVDDLTSVD